MKLFPYILIFCLFISACQSIFAIEDNNNYLPEQDTSPGKKLAIPSFEIWLIENCSLRKLPYIRLDQSEVVPKTADPGTSLRYRLSYTVCIPQNISYLPGRLETKISFKGHTQNRRSDDGYTIETGKWIVDTHIAVPKDAKAGTYILDAALSLKGATLQDQISFNVER